MLSKTHSFWQLAFRPTFLIGTLYSAIAMLAWIGFYSGIINYPGSMPVLTWHIHEMILGFISLIIFGFLFTATQNWTGIRGVNGVKLQALMTLWFLGRVFALSPLNTYWLLLIDVLYLGFSGYLLLPYLKSKSQNRNKIFILTTIGLICFAILASQISINLRAVGLLGVGIVFLVISIIAGRIIPFFTKNAVKSSSSTKNNYIEWLSHVFSFIPFLVYYAVNNKFLIISVFVLAGIVHLIRWVLWKPWQSIKAPILFILPLSYMWTFIGFFLLSIASVYDHLFSLALHSINIGLIGSIIIAMVSRVSLGHTGRLIKASKLMITSYILIQLTAVFRVILGHASSINYLDSVKISGVLWTAAFLLLFISLIPILTQPRVDGRIG